MEKKLIDFMGNLRLNKYMKNIYFCVLIREMLDKVVIFDLLK